MSTPMQHETLHAGFPFILDTGTYTADAYRQPDGTWEIHGHGADGLFKIMVEDAERINRKVAFLPRQAFRKAMRSANLCLKRTGACTLSDGTQVCCSSKFPGFENGQAIMKFGQSAVEVE